MELDRNKLKQFVKSMNDNVSALKDAPVDVADLLQPAQNVDVSEIHDIKKNIDNMQKKLNFLLSAQKATDAVKISHINQNLNYVKDRMDVLIEHNNITGKISSIEMKQLKVNMLKDKINYLQTKLDSILQERERKFRTEKEYSMINKERASVIANQITELEDKLDSMIKKAGGEDNLSLEDKQAVDRLSKKIGELKDRSAKAMSSEHAAEHDDSELKIIQQVSELLEKKKDELQYLESELMLDQGIVEPEARKEEQVVSVRKTDTSQQITMPSPLPGPVQQQQNIPLSPAEKHSLPQYNFELPEFSEARHEFNLDLPSPVPLDEYREQQPLPRPVELPKPKKKGLFDGLMAMFGKKK